jgi:hypothetical protein
VVASFDPRDAEERARFAATAARVDGALREAGADDLTPVAEHHLLAVGLDPRFPDVAADDLLTLVGLGLPAHAFVLPVQGCTP